MPWIESHQSLARHRKLLNLVASLRSDRHKLIGHLHELWWWGLDNADVNGLVGHASPAVLAEAAGWPSKDAERFVSALMEAEFLNLTPDGVVIHDWYEFAGKWYERRAANKERMKQRRAQTQPPHDPGTNGTRATHVLRTDDARTGATVPDRTGPNHTVPETTPVAPSEGAHTDTAKPKETRRKKTAGEHTPITDQAIDELIAKFTPLFGAERKVRLSIDKALNSRARSTWVNERLGVDVWLRGDLEKLREAGKAPRFPMAVPEPADDDGPFEPEVRPMCGTCGVSASVDLAGTTCMACMVKQHQAAKGLRTAG